MIVYLAGPMTHGVREENLRRALEAADALEERGHLALVPQLSYFWNDRRPKTHELWLRRDMIMICKFVDALMVLPNGPEPCPLCGVPCQISAGRDRELALARHLELPVLYELPSPTLVPEWSRVPRGF